jgi:hypothetical protein
MPFSTQVAEVKINGQLHIVYVDTDIMKRRILINIGVKTRT